MLFILLFDIVSSGTLPLLYAGAMLVDAVAALFFGVMYDKKGVRALYDVSIPAMIAVSVIAQLAAIPLYMRSDRFGRPLETK